MSKEGKAISFVDGLAATVAGVLPAVVPGRRAESAPRRRAAVGARHAALLHGSLQGKSGQVRVGLPVVWAAAPGARRRKARP